MTRLIENSNAFFFLFQISVLETFLESSDSNEPEGDSPETERLIAVKWRKRGVNDQTRKWQYNFTLYWQFYNSDVNFRLLLIANNTNHTNLLYFIYTYILFPCYDSWIFFFFFASSRRFSISPLLSNLSLTRFLCLSICSLCTVYIYVWPSIEIAQHYFSLHNNSETLARNLYGCFLRDLDLNFRPEFARGILSLWSTMLVEVSHDIIGESV